MSGCKGVCMEECVSGCKGGCTEKFVSGCKGVCMEECVSGCKGVCMEECVSGCKGGCKLKKRTIHVEILQEQYVCIHIYVHRVINIKNTRQSNIFNSWDIY